MLLGARSGSNSFAIKSHNMRTLLHTFVRRQPISRIRLARITGISTTTVTNLVSELRQAGVVEEVGADVDAITVGAGRTPLALRLTPQSRCALGIHIGVRRARVALVDLQANIISHQAVDLNVDERAEDAIDRILTTAAAMIAPDLWQRTPTTLVGVGVGASGLVETDSGVNILAPNLGWRNVPLRAIVADRLKLPCTVDNNVRCMALAESLYGIGRNTRALAFVYARVGVGAGLVVDGEIYRGAGFGAGEIGHWVLLSNGGEICRCGNRGCLETLISENVLLKLATQIDPALVTTSANPLQTIFAAAREGHIALIELLEDRAYYVGLALANLVNVLNPQLIMLGGWLQEAFDLIEPTVEETMRCHSFGGLGDHVDLLPSSFGLHSGVVGAAVLAFETFFFTPQMAIETTAISAAKSSRGDRQPV
jgi:predicted NBD/HSP70 family sugar kinase